MSRPTSPPASREHRRAEVRPRSLAWTGLIRAWLTDLDNQLMLLIVVFTLPLSLPALRSFFTFDDLMNLHYYLQRPWLSLLSNLIVFTSLHRPLGALVYLPLYATAGLDPVPYYLVGILFFSLNILLAYRLFLHLTGSRFATVLAATLFALHPTIHNVLYNFGAVYELACLTFVQASLLLFIRWSGSPGVAGAPSGRSRPVTSAGRSSGRARRFLSPPYILSLLCFVAALNAKETAVTLPGILFAYAWLYGQDMEAGLRRIWSSLRAIGPFLLLTLPYTLAKALGSEAYWRDNALYVYHFDLGILRRLALYLDQVSNQEISFSVPTGLVVIGLTLLAGLLWRSRGILFGLCWAGLTLLPVLPLPRVWGLFLYLPMIGFALVTASLISEVGGRLARGVAGARLGNVRLGRGATLILTGLFLFRMLGAMTPDIDRSRRLLYQERNPGWRPFAEQLYALYPELPPASVLAFVTPPFDPDSAERWCLHFLVWLKYGDDIRVLRLPQERARLEASVGRGARIHVLAWDGTQLRETK